MHPDRGLDVVADGGRRGAAGACSARCCRSRRCAPPRSSSAPAKETGEARPGARSGRDSEAVGLIDLGDAGEPEFLGQACKVRTAPWPRAGCDELDAEALNARPTWVGLSLSTLRQLGRVPVVAGPVGIERAEQPALPDHLEKCPEARHRALLLDEEGRVDLARGVVHGDDQVERRLAGEPLMARAVLVHHHAGERGRLRRWPRAWAPLACAHKPARSTAPSCIAVLGLVEVRGEERVSNSKQASTGAHVPRGGRRRS